MRLKHRHKKLVTLYKVSYGKSLTGAVTESSELSLFFYASEHPIDQRRWRDPVSLRPIERQMLIPEGFPDCIQGDKIKIEGDERIHRVTEARRYFSHMEIETEVQP
ncbi:MAG: hypothetical protein Q4E07_03745 [Eubacteriales bacterium]|nr:hypothetical protein [Eubacteriales bacterium]